MKFGKVTLITFIFGLGLGLALAGSPRAQAETSYVETPIFPVWQLMNAQAKRQFLAGYLYGFRDAQVLGEIGVQYAKENPHTAITGLTRLLDHYRLTTFGPDRLVPLVDRHFEKGTNRGDSLRIAINKISR